MAAEFSQTNNFYLSARWSRYKLPKF